MVRSTRILEIIEEDNLLWHAGICGKYLQERLVDVSKKNEKVGNVRGLGLITAFDLPSKDMRDRFIAKGMEENVMFLGCGEKTIRFRPALIIEKNHIDIGLDVIEKIIPNL